MKGEIDNDFYCTLGRDIMKQRYLCNNECASCNCEAYHRKWPTPEQYREEYGKEWDGAVYATRDNGTWEGFGCINQAEAVTMFDCQKTVVVCACTPWGKPPADWRPV